MGKNKRLKLLRKQHANNSQRIGNIKENRGGKIEPLFYLLIIPIIVFIASPFFTNGVFSGHDIAIHMVYIRKFIDAFNAGEFPVRFIDWFVPGFSHPLFNFYQPGFYYLFLGVKLLGFSYTLTLKLLIFSIWIISGIGMYLFVSARYGRLSGFVSSAFYLIAPYHILDIFVRAALPEFLGLASVPFIFYGITEFFNRKKNAFLVIIAVATLVTILAHPLTLFLFGIPLILYIVLLAIEKKDFSSFLFSVASIALGFFAAGFFIIPSLLEQGYIQQYLMHSGYYDFHQHFVCWNQLFSPSWGYGLSVEGCNDGMSFQLGIAHWIIFIVAVLFLLRLIIVARTSLGVLPKGLGDRRGEAIKVLVPIIFIICTLFALFMTTELSRSIWESAPFLLYAQYPWRFLAVAAFATSYLAGWILFEIKSKTQKYIVYSILILLLIVSYIWYLRPLKYIGKNDLDFDSPTFLAGKNLDSFQINPENGYFPKWTRIFPDTRISDAEVATKGNGTIKITKTTTIYKMVDADAKNNFSIRFQTHYFPGWQTLIDGKNIQPSYNNDYGFIDVEVPSGNHKVEIMFKETLIRKISDMISLVSLILILFLLFFRRSKKLR